MASPADRELFRHSCFRMRALEEFAKVPMQKTFLKFVVFELVERIARFRLLLNACSDHLHETAPGLKQTLAVEADKLEESLLSHKAQLNKLFAEGASKQAAPNLDPTLSALSLRLQELSRILLQLKPFELEAETHLFLKDALPIELTKDAGEQSVFLVTEGEPNPVPGNALPGVLIDSLSVLQKNNPLAWVGLTKAYSRYLLENASPIGTLRTDLLKNEKKRKDSLTPFQVDQLLTHALNLRLLGPAYYFHALSEAVLQKDEAFLQVMEPALFYGLNHQNFIHKSLVILHEAAEKSSKSEDALPPLSEDTVASLFRAVEKAIPEKAAFQEKHWERAIQLQDRLSQGVLLSSTPLYPVEEVEETYQAKRDNAQFSIYETLSMMTEYPHSPREIVNAGWLHKIERGPVWLYSVLNEDRVEGFERVLELLDYQDHLLKKSIETSEVHRVLLCSA